MNRPSVQSEPRLMTPSETAAYLGYASTNVLRTIPVRPLRLAGVGGGTAPRYDRKALDRWLDELSGLVDHHAAEGDAPLSAADQAFLDWTLRRAT